MTSNVAFRRKVIYLAIIAVLLIPLSYISRPATQENPGGVISQMRLENDLSHAKLGEVDPTGATMQLATLGMRGPAATILWQQGIYYKKTENWDQYAATLNQISKLQPHFVSVWHFQAWNLSYNISVEFDDYEERYLWVKKGCDFLIEGVRYNRDSPRMLKELGWFFGHKFGRSDEYRQFRRKFKQDFDFHNGLPIDMNRTIGADGYPDNWLVAWLWMLQAQEAADVKGRTDLGDSPLVFHSKPPMQVINYAEAIEEDGYLDEKARIAWERALREWLAFGDRSIPTSWGVKIQLNMKEPLAARADVLRAELDELCPGVREEIEAEKLADLSDEAREARDTPQEDRTDEQHNLVYETQESLKVTHHEVAARAPADARRAARDLAQQLTSIEQEMYYIGRYRQIVNFEYWRTRCQVEQTAAALDARRYLLEADELFRQAILESFTNADGIEQLGARETYELAFENWAAVYDEHPELVEAPEAEDLIEPIKQYERVLQQLDVAFPPEGFPLMNVIEENDQLWYQQLQAQGPSLGTGGGTLPEDESPPPDEPADEESTEDPPADTEDESAPDTPPAEEEESEPVDPVDSVDSAEENGADSETEEAATNGS